VRPDDRSNGQDPTNAGNGEPSEESRRNEKTDVEAEQNEINCDNVPNEEVTNLMKGKKALNQARTAFQEQSHNRQELETYEAEKRRRLSTERFWIPELVSLLLALSSFIAILVILSRYKGNLQPSWRHGITINAVVAVLATAMRAFLVAVVEEGELASEIVLSLLAEGSYSDQSN
jgi:hypothetical protein